MIASDEASRSGRSRSQWSIITSTGPRSMPASVILICLWSRLLTRTQMHGNTSASMEQLFSRGYVMSAPAFVNRVLVLGLLLALASVPPTAVAQSDELGDLSRATTTSALSAEGRGAAHQRAHAGPPTRIAALSLSLITPAGRTDGRGRAEDLEGALQDLQTVGFIWTGGSLGYALKYAHRTEDEAGGERIVLVTDRPLGQWDPNGPWAGSDGSGPAAATFTVVELHLAAEDGQGEGKLSSSAPIEFNAPAQTVGLADYALHRRCTWRTSPRAATVLGSLIGRAQLSTDPCGTSYRTCGAAVDSGGIEPRTAGANGVPRLREHARCQRRGGHPDGSFMITVPPATSDYPALAPARATQKRTASVAAPRAVSDGRATCRPPCEVLRPSRPAAAPGGRKPAVQPGRRRSRMPAGTISWCSTWPPMPSRSGERWRPWSRRTPRAPS